MGLLAIIIIIIIVFIIYFFISSSNISELDKQALIELGIEKQDRFYGGRFICGHPNIDSPIQVVSLALKDNDLIIFSPSDKIATTIPLDRIKNILIEDATTMEKRVTVGRLLTIGIFAFAMKKKEIKEISYLIIEWSDGRFSHETIFEFEIMNSLEYSNKAKNKIINYISNRGL